MPGQVHHTGWKRDYGNLTSEIHNIQTIEEVKQVLNSNSFSFSEIFLEYNESATNYSSIYTGSIGKMYVIKPLQGSVTLDHLNTLNIQLNTTINYYLVYKIQFYNILHCKKGNF